MRIRGLGVTLNGLDVLRDIDLDVSEGEFLGIVGPNGGGKTTLLKVILGLVVPSSGTIEIFGGPPDEIVRSGGFGYLPQHAHIDPRYPARALDVVLMGLYKGPRPFRGFSKADRTRAEEALETLGAAHLSRRPYGTLSGGQRQRLDMARALVGQPRVILLDEPSTGVDAVGQEDFYHLLQGLKRKRQLSIVMVSHDIGVVSAYVDRMACLNRTLHYHGSPVGALDHDVLEALYGKSVDLLQHSPACEACERLRR